MLLQKREVLKRPTHYTLKSRSILERLIRTLTWMTGASTFRSSSICTAWLQSSKLVESYRIIANYSSSGVASASLSRCSASLTSVLEKSVPTIRSERLYEYSYLMPSASMSSSDLALIPAMFRFWSPTNETLAHASHYWRPDQRNQHLRSWVWSE